MGTASARPFNGAILINKASGPTSHDVVAQIRRITGQKSVGHTGTLDPMASGLMVVLLGEATKCSDLILATNKSYRLKLRLGVVTDSLDITGVVQRTSELRPTKEVLTTEVEKLNGDLLLPVPWYSAAKVNGKKLVDLARNKTGEELAQIADQPPIKTMNFYGVKILNTSGDEATIELSCSKGSFVRSWVYALGERLGCGACLTELTRLSCGAYDLVNAVTVDDLAHLSIFGMEEERHPALIQIEHLLPELKACLVNSKEEHLLNNGQIPRALWSRLLPEVRLANFSKEEITIKVISGQKDCLLALLVARPGKGLKFKRVFSHPELTMPLVRL